MALKDKYDILIIGAGIIGLTIAKEISDRKLGSVLILEKESALGRHASGRNSGVLHSGIYYPKDSLKAKYCKHGADKLYRYAHEKGIAVQKNGKVIVAPTPKDRVDVIG